MKVFLLLTIFCASSVYAVTPVKKIDVDAKIDQERAERAAQIIVNSGMDLSCLDSNQNSYVVKVDISRPKDFDDNSNREITITTDGKTYPILKLEGSSELFSLKITNFHIALKSEKGKKVNLYCRFKYN